MKKHISINSYLLLPLSSSWLLLSISFSFLAAFFFTFSSAQEVAPPSYPPAPPDPTNSPAVAPDAPTAPTGVNAPAPPSGATATVTTTDGGGKPWTGCVDPIDGYKPVTIGERTTICLVLANNGDWTTDMKYIRLLFQPIADNYSRFWVPDSFRQLVATTEDTDVKKLFPGNVTIHTESQTHLSFQRLYFNGVDRVFPFLTAVVDVRMGNVTGITWDDGCVFCSASECEDNTYGYDGNLQNETQARQRVGGCRSTIEACETSEKRNCDIVLYVVWTGTDSKGKDFMSSSNRFSAFPKQSWSDRINLGLPTWFENIIPVDGEPSANRLL